MPDASQRIELLTALVNLIGDEGVLKMIERMVDDELLNTPFLRRVREEGRQKGVEEGRQEGRQEGRREGVEEGLRSAVLATLATRFDFSVHTYQRIEQRLYLVRDLSALQHLLECAVRAANPDVFQAELEVTMAGHRTDRDTEF